MQRLRFGRSEGPVRRRAAASEDGWALMEVVVAAAVLAIAVLAILAGLDASARSSNTNKQRTVASALAEQDLERMRNMRVEDLSTSYTNTAFPLVSGVKYKVDSAAEWVRDDSGAGASCADDGSDAGSYLKISSTVRAATGAQTQPITLTSLMAPPVGAGQLAVRVRNAAAQPVSNATINIVGPDPDGSPADTSVQKSGATNDTGCVMFPFLPAGTYSITMNAADWVDQQGNAPPQTEQGVRPATISTATLVADLRAIVNVGVKTTDATTGALVDDRASGSIQVANPALQPEGLKTFPSSATQLAPLFPFPAGYTLYTGCQASNPTNFDPNYFSAHQESVPKPGPDQTVSATIREPALNIQVRRGTSPAPYRSAHVVVKSLTCGDVTAFNRSRSSTGLSLSGGLPSPGMPFGHYQVCADDGTRRVLVPDIDNTNENGTSTQILPIPTSGTRVTCNDSGTP